MFTNMTIRINSFGGDFYLGTETRADILSNKAGKTFHFAVSDDIYF